MCRADITGGRRGETGAQSSARPGRHNAAASSLEPGFLLRSQIGAKIQKQYELAARAFLRKLPLALAQSADPKRFDRPRRRGALHRALRSVRVGVPQELGRERPDGVAIVAPGALGLGAFETRA